MIEDEGRWGYTGNMDGCASWDDSQRENEEEEEEKTTKTSI